MQSVALDQSARFPNDDDEYVVVEFRGAEPSQADPLEEIADDEDEEEYDYCDDIDSCSFAWHSGIPQSISFEEVSDRLGTSSAFYFGDEANQLLLELDNSASLLQEIPSFGGPVIASYPSCYDNTLSDDGFAAVGNTGVGTASSLKSPNAKHAEESSTTEKSKDFKEPSGAPITSVICEVHEKTKPRTISLEHEPEPTQRGISSNSGSSTGSRMTNKKRRKQMKLAKKAAAAAAASLANMSTLSHRNHNNNNMSRTSESHPSMRQKINVTAMQTPARGTSKNQLATNSFAVDCATQSLAVYRMEPQMQQINSTTSAATSNKLVR